MPESLFTLSLMVVGSTIGSSFIATMVAVRLVRVLTGKVSGTPRVLVAKSVHTRFPAARS